MSQRYFVETPITADRAVLTGPEAHHLIHVMRLPEGAMITLFDGSGCEFAARVEHVRHAEVELGILARTEVDRELPRLLILGVALPKGDRQKWLVEKAVELGLGRLVPLETARSVARPTGQALARLRRTVIEASKQCGRNRLLEIASPQGWAEFVGTADGNSLRLFAHPQAGEKWPNPRAPGAEVAVLAVGPEGGFTDEEVARAVAAGWQQVDLGPRILRVETAALALVAQVVGLHSVGNALRGVTR